MTGFLPTATNAWLDEVIVSSAPIPAPAPNGGGIPQHVFQFVSLIRGLAAIPGQPSLL
jgi:hypothetical protein